MNSKMTQLKRQVFQDQHKTVNVLQYGISAIKKHIFKGRYEDLEPNKRQPKDNT